HHLILQDADAVKQGPALKVNPPLRTADDVLSLREALADGTIDVVSTDHAPHPRSSKDLGWRDSSFGLTGVETALPIVAEVLTQSGVVHWQRVEQVMASAPDHILVLPGRPQRGLELGMTADFCVVDSRPFPPLEADRMYSKSSNSAFAGRILNHRVVLTL